MADFSKLKQVEEADTSVDWDAVRQFIELEKEIEKTENEYNRLCRIMASNVELTDYTWKTRLGNVIAIKDLSDQHLTNIVRMHLKHEGVSVRKELLDEFKERKLKEETLYETNG